MIDQSLCDDIQFSTQRWCHCWLVCLCYKHIPANEDYWRDATCNRS